MDHAPAAPSTALVVTGSSSPRLHAPPSDGPPRTGAPKQKKLNDHRSSPGNPAAPGGGAPSSGSSTGATPGPGTPWPSFYISWTDTIQIWPGPLTPPLAQLPHGRAGPQQQQAQQQALLAQQQHQPKVQQQALLPRLRCPCPAAAPSADPVDGPTAYQPMVGSPLWDQNSLASMFSTMNLTLPGERLVP